jgi:dihydropyrimidinase
MHVTGWPVTTLVRGERVWDGGEVRGRSGFGQFLPCGRPDMARPKVVEPVEGRYLANASLGSAARHG